MIREVNEASLIRPKSFFPPEINEASLIKPEPIFPNQRKRELELKLDDMRKTGLEHEIDELRKKCSSLELETYLNREQRAIVVGPWGGHGGTSWDDGSYNGVRGITLQYASCINSIRIVYDKNGEPVTTEKHGGVGGSKTAEIKLQFPDEFLMTVTGHYSPVAHGGTSVIRSLTIKSNRRTFGPYGVEEGTPFLSPMEGGQIIGFKGRSGRYLDAIGLHISKIETPKVAPKAQLKFFKRFDNPISSAAPRYDSYELPGAAPGYDSYEFPGAAPGHKSYELPGAAPGHKSYELPGAAPGHKLYEFPGARHKSYEFPGAALGYESYKLPGFYM